MSASSSPEAESAAEAAQQYLEAFASADPDRMDTMVSLSAPGSAAHAYAVHQQAVARAFEASGEPATRQAVTVDGDSIELCGDGDAKADCGQYTDFEALPDGKLVTFKVNGTAIDARLLPATERAPVAAAEVSLQLISAYRTIQSNSLFMTFKATNASAQEVTFAMYDADYLSAEGQQSKAEDATGLTDLQPGASTTMLVSVGSEDPGGTLSVQVFDADFDDVATLKVPIK